MAFCLFEGYMKKLILCLLIFSFLGANCDINQSPNAPAVTSINQNIGKDLVIGKTTISNGEKVYFGFEIIDKDNYQFWEDYTREARKIAETLKLYPGKIKNIKIEKNRKFLDYPNRLATSLGYTQKEHQELINFFKNSPKNIKTDDSKENYFWELFEGVLSGFTGMHIVKSSVAGKRSYFVIYASKIPVTKRFKNEDYDENLNYRKNFGNIIMSMSGVTAFDVPTVTHTGIARNPIEFLADKLQYPRISMELHGFGAQVWLKFFQDKKYMITRPLDHMAKIFSDSGLVRGTNFWIKNLPAEVQTLKDDKKDFEFSVGVTELTTVTLEALALFYKGSVDLP
jgi:hypothetical protein